MSGKFQSSKIDISSFAEGILGGNRVILAQAITLIESGKKEDRYRANQLIEKILPFTGSSIRIGVTGAPGVGKSTFIECFGKHVINQGKRIAVLAIDPSSSKSKGSILGDKTRMENLSKDSQAFIRPTATGAVLGGVASHTKETILLCEAAGFNVIVVETVGVGQSEVAVRGMVDFFLLLILAGAGDELQGIKKGIMEMADSIVITKADDENMAQAEKAKGEYQHALHLFELGASGWNPRVLTCSALNNSGIEGVWQMIEQYQRQTFENNFFVFNRNQQEVKWFHASLDLLIRTELFKTIITPEEINQLEKNIKDKELSPIQATERVLDKVKAKLGLFH